MEMECTMDMTDVTSIYLLWYHMQSTLIPFPNYNVFTQWFLQHHQICNLEAEPMKMNELFDGREDHPLIPSIPWYLTQILYSKPKLYQLIQDASTSPSGNQVHSLLFLWDPQKFPILIPMQRLESVNRWFWWFLRFDCCNILLSNQFNSQ